MVEPDAETEACCRGQPWCAVTCTTEVLSRKWHTLLVHTLLDAGPSGFSELETAIEDISGKVLSESLDDLVDHGLVERTTLQQSPRRVEYSLTGAGRDLEPVVEAMEAWGRKHLSPAEGGTGGVRDPFGNRLR